MKVFTRNEQYSGIFNDVLKTGKGLNVAMNNCHIIRQLIKHDSETLSLWESFVKLLKSSKMRLTLFAIGFDKQAGQYHIAYQIESKVHSNQPLRIDRKFDSAIPFSFVPSAFPEWLRATLNDLPTTLIAQVASGG